MPERFLSVVIPAFNEAQRIRSTLEKVCHFREMEPYSIEVIAVDDGSKDETIATVTAFPGVRLLQNGRNRGKGFSVRHGVLEAQGEFVLFTDADLSTPIEDVRNLLSALQDSGADAAVGSRALNRELIGVHQPWFREMAGRIFNLLVRTLMGLSLSDTQCGFKLFRRSTTRAAFQLQRVEGFGFDPELLFLLKKQGRKVVEVPVRWNNDTGTKVHFLRDSTRMFLDLIAVRWRSLKGDYNTA